MFVQYYQGKISEMLGDRRVRLNRPVDGKSLLLELAGELGELINGYKHDKLWHRSVAELEEASSPSDTYLLPRTRDELGDVFWYLFAFCESEGIDVVSVLQANIQKLNERYGEVK